MPQVAERKMVGQASLQVDSALAPVEGGWPAHSLEAFQQDSRTMAFWELRRARGWDELKFVPSLCFDK